MEFLALIDMVLLMASIHFMGIHSIQQSRIIQLTADYIPKALFAIYS